MIDPTPELANRENSPGLYEWLDMLEKNPDILAGFVEGARDSRPVVEGDNQWQ